MDAQNQTAYSDGSNYRPSQSIEPPLGGRSPARGQLRDEGIEAGGSEGVAGGHGPTGGAEPLEEIGAGPMEEGLETRLETPGDGGHRGQEDRVPAPSEGPQGQAAGAGERQQDRHVPEMGGRREEAVPRGHGPGVEPDQELGIHGVWRRSPSYLIRGPLRSAASKRIIGGKSPIGGSMASSAPSPRPRFLVLPCLGLAALFVHLAGCAPQKKAAPRAVRPVRRAAPAPAPVVDIASQQKAYERGLKSFGEERYAEAQAAWEEAVRLGPGTPIGRKSQEHLKKVAGMLETLQELDAK